MDMEEEEEEMDMEEEKQEEMEMEEERGKEKCIAQSSCHRPMALCEQTISAVPFSLPTLPSSTDPKSTFAIHFC